MSVTRRFASSPFAANPFSRGRAFRLAKFVVPALLVLICNGPSRAADKPAEKSDKPDLKSILSRPLLAPQQSLTELQAFAAARIPPMPDVKTTAEWETLADRMRKAILERVVFRGEAAAWRDTPGAVEWLDVIPGGPGYRIRKLRYEALPGLWIPGLLYEPETLSGKVPVFLNVNGHDRSHGKAAVYKQMLCINMAKRGILNLNVEWLGMGQLHTNNLSHYRMNQLDLCGTSGLAPFYLNMSRALDLLLAHEHADPTRVGVAGLSGGGWQTIISSSLDPRVTLANPVAGYSSFLTRGTHFSDLGDSEQSPVDLATIADYSQLTAMRAPHPTLLTYNLNDDCCFKADHALPPLLAAAGPIYQLYGKEGHLRSHVNALPGNHNFEKDNRQVLYRMLGDHFFPKDATFSAEEIPSDAEVKTIEEFNVPLPTINADFHSLASQLAERLPREPGLPAEMPAATAWQSARREKLTEIVRSRKYDVQSEAVGEDILGEGAASQRAVTWRLKLGDWTIPAVDLVQGEPKETVILVGDEGRAALADATQAILTSGKRVVAVDPLFIGESKLETRGALFGLLISTVGDRPLGLQASQLAAVARWARTSPGTDKSQGMAKVTIVAHGPRSALAALVAAALEPEAIAGVELHSGLGSLKETIEQNKSVDQAWELFCFGLLEWFDTPQLVALVAPRPVIVQAASERAKRELSGLKAFYALFGQNFDPLQ